MNRQQCLEKAAKIVTGQREKIYSGPEDSFLKIARLWNAYLNNMGCNADLLPHDVALMMDLMKTARLQADCGHKDGWVDKAGYAACGCEITTEGKP